MGDEQLTVTARVQVTLDIELRGAWGPECSVAQVHKQAVDEARHVIRKAFEGRAGVTVVSLKPTALAIPKP